MPRHAFRYPDYVRSRIREYVFFRMYEIDAIRYRQESQYVSALIHSLEGLVYRDDSVSIRFEATAFDDRGRNSAESILGADFAITATVSNPEMVVRKALLVQAKIGEIEHMSLAERERLKAQIRKMKHFTASPKVMDTIELGNRRFPMFASGNRILRNLPYRKYRLDEYIVQRIITTFDGDTDQEFVDKVQDSSVPKLRIRANSTTVL